MSTLVVERASSEGAEALQAVRKASNLYEARSENVRNVSGEDLRRLAVDMEKVSPSAPTHTVLSTAADQHVHLCTSKMSEVPFGCILSYQLLDAEHIEVPGARKRPFQRTAPPSQHATQQQPCDTIQAGTEEDNSEALFCDIPLPKSCQPNDPHASPILVAKAIGIERLTRSKKPRWQLSLAIFKSYTLTASKFFRAVHRREPDDAFISSLFATRDLSHVQDIQHGRQQEEEARKDYQEAKRQSGNPNFKVRQSGLVLHPAYDYLGARPDGQVYDPHQPEDPKWPAGNRMPSQCIY